MAQQFRLSHNQKLLGLNTFFLGSAVRQTDRSDSKAAEHLAHLRMIVDVENETGFEASESVSRL